VDTALRNEMGSLERMYGPGTLDLSTMEYTVTPQAEALLEAVRETEGE
jgi:hypothetical protein